MQLTNSIYIASVNGAMRYIQCSETQGTNMIIIFRYTIVSID